MKTIIHIFKKDSLQQRPGIVFFTLLLLMQLFSNLHPVQEGGVGPALFGTLAFYLLIGAAVIILSAVMADPLGNHQAFYRTRPIRMRDVVGAKVLFLLAWIVLPTVLSESIYLAAHSLPSALILAAAVERLLFITVFGIAIGAGMTAFPNAKSAARTLLLCIPIPFFSAMIWDSVSQSLSLSSLSPSRTSPLGLLLFGVTALVIFAFAASQAAKRPLSKIAVCIPMLLVGCAIPLFATSWQSGLGATRGLDQTLPSHASTSLRRANLTVTAYDHGTDPEKLQVQITARPNVPYVPASITEWAVKEMTLKDSQAKLRSDAFRRPPGRVFQRRTSSSQRGLEIEAIASLLPAGVRLSHGNTGSWASRPTVSGSVSTVRRAETIDQPVSLSGSLRGREFTWKLVGEIPFEPGARLSSGETTWRFLSLKQHENKSFDIRLAWQRPALRLSRRQDWKYHSSDILSRHEFLVVQEADNIGFSPESAYTSIGIGYLSAYEKNQVTLQFHHTRHHNLMLPEADPTRAKIMVFEKVYQREIELPWQVSSVELANHFQGGQQNNLKPAEKMSRQEFVSRLQALGEIPLGKTRAEAGRYLYKVAKLVQERDQWIRPGDPLAQQLAPLAQEHPTMFLDGLRNAHYRPAQLLKSSLQQGLQEEQLNFVIERLPQQPQLAELAVTRGWLEPARDAFRQLAEQHSRLPISAVQALVFLQEKSTYPLLLADFQENPSLNYYDILRTVPEIEAELDEIVRKQWDRRPRVFSHRMNQQELYSIALRHGIQEAITEICQMLTWIPIDDYSYGYGISRAIEQNVDLQDLPRNERNNSKEVLSWLSQQDPQSFRYDPGRRLFYVQKA